MSTDPMSPDPRPARTAPRTARRSRTTKETDITIELNLDGTGVVDVSTGIPFFDHMLDQIGRHGGFDLSVRAEGDLHVDGHHTVEDTGILLGEVLREALGDKAGVRRFASGLYPLDEALIEVALDLSGRPYLVWNVTFGEILPLGNPPFNPEMTEHFFRSLADSSAVTLHVTSKGGVTAHHIIEATFKGVARTLRDAVRVEGDQLPSTKGVL